MTDSTTAYVPFSLAAVPPTAFTYVAEGGANLVAAYTGDTANDEFLRGTVLRIRKRAHGAPILSETTLKEEDASVAFTDNVVVPLLPPRSTPRLVSVPIHDRVWFEVLAKHLQSARPASRRSVDDIDLDRGYVVLADNLVGTASDESMQLAVEIKPKWGFLPNPTHLSDRSRPIKTKHCRFCLHRLYKSNPSPDEDPAQSSHSAAEDYCPLDLYSQDRERVLKALHALVKSWEQTNGKGNNLKLFYEGEMVIPSENTGFLGDMKDTEQSLPSLLADFITTSPLVSRLSDLQSSLDPLDIEGLNTLLVQQKGIDLLNVNEKDLREAVGGEITLEEYSEFVTSYLTRTKTSSSDSFLNEQSPLRRLIIAYLLSASFKDCSMIITIKQNPLSQEHSKNVEAYLVDVDLKSIKRLSRYAKLDNDLIESFESFGKTGRGMKLCRI